MALTDEQFDALMSEVSPKTEPGPEAEPISEESSDGWQSKGMQPNTPTRLGDLKRGLDNLESTGGGAIALLGRMIGSTSMEEWGMNKYYQETMEARQNPAEIGTYKNINSAGDAFTYMAEAVLENAAMFLPGLVTGGIGGALAKKGAETYVKNLVNKIGKEEAEKLISKRILIGSTLGSYPSSAVQEMGSIYGDTVEETGEHNAAYAFFGGAAAGLLDAVPEGMLLTKIIGRDRAGKIAQGLINRIGIEGAKQFLREAPTELMQTVIEESAITNVTGEDLFSEERWQHYIDAGLKGGISGGVLGGGGALFMKGGLKSHPNPSVREAQEDLDNRTSELVDDDAINPPEQLVPTPDEQRFADVTKEIITLQTQLGADIPQEEKDNINTRIVDLFKEQAELEAKLQTGQVSPTTKGQPLVNEKPTTETGVPGTFGVGDTLVRKDGLKIEITGPANEAGAYPIKTDTGEEVLFPGDKIKEEIASGLVTYNPSIGTVERMTLESKRGALQEQQAFLKSLTPEQVGMTTNEYNSRMKEIEAQLADDGKLNTLQSIPTYPFVSREIEGVEKEQVDAAREQIHSEVNTLTDIDDTSPEAAEYRGVVKAAFEPLLNFFAGEQITIKKSSGKVRGETKELGWRIVPRANGAIEIQVPSFAKWKKVNQSAIKNGSFQQPTSLFGKYAEHEAIHASMYIEFREAWKRRGKPGNFNDYVSKRLKQIGGWLQTSYRGLAPDLLGVYDPGKSLRAYGNSAEEAATRDEVVGGEFLRMLVERARTGKLTEDVAAQAQAAKNGGIATQALNSLLRAIQKIREVIARYLNPSTSTPAIQKIYQQMNDVLDKYQIIMPEAKPPISQAKPKISEEPENAPTPKQEPEREDLPELSEEEREARRELSERLVNEKRVAPSRRAYLRALEAARDAIEKGYSNAPELIQAAAISHVRSKLKWGNKFATKKNRLEGRQEFETALQHKVTQSQYDKAIAEVKAEPVDTGGLEATPEEEANTQIANELGITYDGNMMGRLEQFTDTDESSPAFGATFHTRLNPTKEQVEAKLKQKREEFGPGKASRRESVKTVKPKKPGTFTFKELFPGSVTLNDVYDKIEDTGTEGQKNLAQFLRALNLNPKVFVNSRRAIAREIPVKRSDLEDAFGYWTIDDNGNTFVAFIEDPTERLTIRQANNIILHELLHDATAKEVWRWDRTGRDPSSPVAKLNEIYEYAKENGIGGYAMTDIDEFIAGIFTSSTLIGKLRGMKWKESKTNSLWDEVIRWISETLGITSEDTLLREAMRQAMDIAQIQKKRGEILVNENNASENEVGVSMVAPEDQIHSENFKKWFGDWENNPREASKVVDVNGKPLVVWHAGANIEIFDTAISTHFIGTHFGTRKSAETRSNNTSKAVIRPFFLNIRNPIIWPRDEMGFQNAWGLLEDAADEGYITRDDLFEFQEKYPNWVQMHGTKKFSSAQRDVMDFLLSKGVDGIKYTNRTEHPGSTSWIVFGPNQIKSADSNSGKFSTEEPGVSGASPEMEDADSDAMRALESLYSVSALVNENPETRESKMIKHSNLIALEADDFEYQVQHQGPATFAAIEFVRDQGGIVKTYDHLITNRIPSGLDGGEITQVYNVVIRGLNKMRSEQEEGMAALSPEEVSHLYGMSVTLQKQFVELSTELGQFNSAHKADSLFMDGDRAKQDMQAVALERWTKKFGFMGKKWLEGMTEKLNSIRQKVTEGIYTRGEFISFLRQFIAAMDTKEGRAALRKTWAAKDPKKMSGLAKKGSLRAATMGFGDLSNEPALKAAATRILADMNFVPKQDNPEEGHVIFSAAIAEVTRELGKKTGLIPKANTKTKITELQKLSEILANPELYNAFVSNLEERMIDRFGGGRDNPHFREAMANFVMGMRNRTWMNGLIERVISEKMREMKIGLQREITKLYKGNKTSLEDVVSAVRAGLKEFGLSEEIIHETAQEIESTMESMIDRAKEKFMVKKGTIQRGLLDIGESMAKYAGSGFTLQDSMKGKLIDHFITRLGLPNTKSHPYASRLREIIDNALSEQVKDYDQRILDNLLKQAPPIIQKAFSDKKARDTAIEKIIRYANMGILSNPGAYSALAPRLKLPPYSIELAERVSQAGRAIADMQPGRARTAETIKLHNILESQMGVDWKTMMVAGMYSSMLSGPSTLLGINPLSNLLNLISEIYTESLISIRNGHADRIPAMVRGVFSAMFGGGWIEFKETLRTGLVTGKLNVKIEGGNPLEYEDPLYLDPVAEKLGFLLTRTNAKYVVRFLQATDMMFYKAAQELSFAKNTGFSGYGHALAAYKTEAREELENQGIDTESREGARKVDLLALEKLERAREMNPETAEAWKEAHGDAIRITYNQEPKGWIGSLATVIGRWTAKYPAAKVIVPFTRVVANVLNTQLEWTPYGVGRWIFSNDFKIKDADGQMVRDPRILIRAATGTVIMSVLGMMLAKFGDDDDPYFMIYGSGPVDANKRRQLYERGWKPNTIKIGNSYISYLPTPMAVSLAAIGTVMDKYRDDPEGFHAIDIIPQMALAFVQGTLHQSFLSSVADLFAAFDSADPERAVHRFGSRTLTLWVPNLFKQIDAWADPSVQQSDNFLQMMIKQVPLVRWGLKPMLNVFGEPVERVQGPLNIPFSNRFWTTEKTDDPVLSFLAQKNLSVPAYSKVAKVNGKLMTDEQYYRYIAKAGPQIKAAIRNEIPSLRGLPKQEAQDRINDIAEMTKRSVRQDMSR